MSDGRRNVSSPIPEVLFARLEKKLESTGKTRAEYIRRLIEDDLNGTGSPHHGGQQANAAVEQAVAQNQQELEQLTAEVAQLKSAVLSFADAIDGIRRCFRHDQFQFFQSLVSNSHLLPDQGEKLSEVEVRTLLQHMFPEEFQ